MDEITSYRQRYPRYTSAGRSTANRKKKRTAREEKTIIDIFARQMVIAILLLLTVAIIKNINTPAAKTVSDNIKSVLSWDIDTKGVFDQLNNFAGGLMEPQSTGKPNKEQSNNSPGFDEPAVPVNAAVTTPRSDNPSDNGEVNPIDRYNFILPVQGFLSSPYGGYVTDPATGVKTLHQGIDIEAQKGAVIKPVLDGEVEETGEKPEYGMFIKLKHIDGLETIYAGCSEILVAKGDKVKQGDTIAKVGNTELTTGAHLHFEVWVDGKNENPLLYIDVPTKT